MKKITSYFSRFILVSLLVPHYGLALDERTILEDGSIQGALSAADTAIIDAKTAPENPLTETKEAESLQESATIEFKYVNEDITNIVNSLATKKGVNVIIPLGANALANKVTLSLPNRITLDEAWAFLQTFLDLSGYSMIPRGDMYYITKKNAAVAKEPLPLFVGMKPSDLPDTDERIRYIYYLSNIKVSDAADNELATLLKDLLPFDGAFKMDPPSNGLIISARSREIKSLMEIIVKLDKVGFLEKFEIFRLRFTNAKDVADLFNNSLLKTDADPNRYRLDTKRTTDATYFSKFTRIIPDGRTNSLIILGRFQAIERIKEFIRLYIDIKIETGKSPLHIYDLQYLKAEEIAPILEKIIQDDLGGGTGQSQAGGVITGGTQRSFGEVKILADTPKQAAPAAGQDAASLSYYGGNKLIIACSNDDWQEIEKLIQSLDQPRSQVLIEVLIADLTVEDLRELGTSIRNPGGVPMPGNMNFQTTNLHNEFITDGTSPDKTIKADLLGNPLTPRPLPKALTFVGRDATQGSMAISFNDADGKVWGVAELAKNFGAKKVLSAPHMIATNNQKASIIRSEKRLLRDQSSSTASNSTIAFKWVEADLTVKITPRISEQDDVTMQIEIKVNQFRASTTSADTETPVRTTRELSANATVGNNNILVLGGLVRLDDSSSSSSTPLLGKIPILRWFFSGRQDNAAKTNLTIFIKPIVIRPRLRAGLQKHTQEFLNYIDNYTGKGALFESLKDPVTKIFFANEGQATNMVDDFMRFKKEEVEKTAGAPIQNIDLTDGNVDSPKKERQRKKEAQLKKNKAAQELAENEGMQAEKASPTKSETAEAEKFFSENEAAREDLAKKLLQDAKNPLIDRQQEPPVQDNLPDKENAP